MGTLTGIWDWFATQAGPFFIELAKRTVEYSLYALRKWLGIAAFVWSLVVGFLGLTIWAIGNIGTQLENFNLSTWSGPVATMLQYYNFMNHFIPLGEAFAGAVLYFNGWLIITSIRWIKSFIPTISN